ncbi:MAG: GIY-YIG nuclease family protein [Candidatus Paceibacterota bacterium]|jgi:excinuclease ABC subunit C
MIKMNSQYLSKINLPTEPGIYLFKNNKNILYIGKATSLKDRVRSYFANDLIATRGPLIVDMIFQADNIDFIQTDSVLEALILESNLIKKYQPRYNTKEKDDRSYNYVIITKEDFPRVLIERGRVLNQIDNTKYAIKEKFGPFTNGTQLKEALKIVRKIFPFLDDKSQMKTGYKFYKEIGLAPETLGDDAQKDYIKNIKNLSLFFQGKKTDIIKNLEKEMKVSAKKQEFEKAEQIKRTIFALNHIQDVALIKNEDTNFLRESASSPRLFRIEAYDVAHISGTNTVGVMTVVENGTVNKAEYRKFKINESKQNDVAGLGEMLKRRLNHEEWKFPDIIVVDGSTAQKNIAEKTLKQFGVSDIIVVAVTKDARHRPRMITGRLKQINNLFARPSLDGLGEDIVHKYESEILIANSEAHRFAIKYHRSLRNKIL